MSALCADELRRDQQWEAIRRDPELLAAVLATTRPRLRSRSEITAEELAALRAALNSDEQPALVAAE